MCSSTSLHMKRRCSLKMEVKIATFVLLWYSIIHINTTTCVLFTNSSRHGGRNSLTNVTAAVANDDRPETIRWNNQGNVAIVGPRTTSESRYSLPSAWIDFCTIRGYITYDSEYSGRVNMTSIQCLVTSAYSGIWRLDDLRRSVDAIPDANLHLDVHIMCTGNANISLPESVKVNYLFRLCVRSCVITDWLSEYNDSNVSTYADSLRTKKFIDITVTISLRNYIGLMENIEYITKDYLCKHEETIENIVVRNISYTFIFDMMLLDPSKLGSQFSRGATRIEHVCIYRHLTSMEETHHNSMSVYHGTLLTENSVFDELKYINMSYNYITVLKDEQIQWSLTFPKLKLFDLSHNEISVLYRFEIPIHPPTDGTTVFDLRYNNISAVTVRDLDRYSQLPMMYIDIRNNDINCSCSENMKELIRYIQDKKHLDIVVNDIDKNYSYIGELICIAPPELAGRHLNELTPRSVCPVIDESTREYFLVPLVIMGVVLVIMSAVIVVLLRYRREVMILIYTRCHVMLPCQSRYCGDHKRYDAFVSYSSKEDDWVESFFEQLEQPTHAAGQQFRFCLHHRDFIPGKTIFDNVVNSVEQSRHTVILLSRHYMASEFCLYEFQEAFRQSITERRRHLVVVLMEEIREGELPASLRRCIKTFTYIRRHDFLFRDRLVYALSIKENTKRRGKKPKTTTEVNKVPKCLNSQDDTDRPIPVKTPPRDNKRELSQITNRDKLTPLNINVRYNANELAQYNVNTNVLDTDTDKVVADKNSENTHVHDNACFVLDKGDGRVAGIERRLPADLTPGLDKDNYSRSVSTFSYDTGYFSSSPSCTDTPSPAEFKNGLIPVNIGQDSVYM